MFYIGALGVIMAVVPWNTIDGTTSPFVQIFDSVGVHAAAGILNFVCLTAVMSVYNSGLYANSRMLYSLARQGNAPEILGKLNFHGVPVVGVLASAAITALAVVVVFLCFRFRVQLSDVDCHHRRHHQLDDDYVHRDSFPSPCGYGDAPNGELAGLTGDEALGRIHFKLPFARVMPYVVLAFLAFVVVLMCFSSSYRVAVIAGVVWLAILLTAYQVTQTRKTVRP